MDIFPFSPDWGAQSEMEPRRRSVRFGDGYEQRAADGLMPYLPTWNLGFSVRTESEASGISGWLRGKQANVSAFLWSVPGDNSVTDHGFGVGDSSRVAFQLQRTLMGSVMDSLGTWPTYTKPRTNACEGSTAVAGPRWANAGNTTVVMNASTAPDGTTTASLVGVKNNDASAYTVGSILYCPVNTPVTFSVYIKAGGAPSFSVCVFEQTLYYAHGVITGPFTAGVPSVTYNAGVTGLTITPVGNGWYRISGTVSTPTYGSHRILIYGDQAGTNSATYFWGAQLEVGSTATRPIATGTSAVTATPAYWPAGGDGFEPITELNGAPTIYREDWQGKVQLYPWQRTNLVTYSEQFDNGVWTKTRGSVTANTAPAPNGTTTADKFTEDTSASTSHYIVGPTLTSDGGQVTFSVMASSSTRYLWMSLDGSTSALVFDLVGGTISGSVGGNSGGHVGTISKLPEGFWRCSITRTVPAGNFNPFIGLTNVPTGTYSYTGDGIGCAWLFGAQVEKSSTPTAYIPTTSAAASVTDYTLSTSGLVTFATAPAAGAALSWTGSYFFRFIADKWTPPRPDGYSSWSVSATFRQVPA